MNRLPAIALSLASLTSASLYAEEQICEDFERQPLLDCLSSQYQKQTDLSYKRAREIMFSDIDNFDGYVTLVYSGKKFKTRTTPNHTIVNTEHTWPQSKFKRGAMKRKMKTDLHHLFPTYHDTNNKRSSLPFAEIDDDEATAWLIENNHGTSVMPPAHGRDQYSEATNREFEPREAHKGAVARAMFYVYAIYGEDAVKAHWFKAQIPTLLAWHEQCPVTPQELERTHAIEKAQGNINPFVTDDSLAKRAFPQYVGASQDLGIQTGCLDEARSLPEPSAQPSPSLNEIVDITDLHLNLPQHNEQMCDTNKAGYYSYYKLAISRSQEWCISNRKPNEDQCTREYIVHGLWPQCDTNAPRECNLTSPDLFDDINRDRIYQTFMPSDFLIRHEWNKHGTCTSFKRSEYYDLTEHLFDAVSLPELDDGQYDRDDLYDLYISNNEGLEKESIELRCNSDSHKPDAKPDTLDEVRICFDKTGSFMRCKEHNSSCPQNIRVREM